MNTNKATNPQQENTNENQEIKNTSIFNENKIQDLNFSISKKIIQEGHFNILPANEAIFESIKLNLKENSNLELKNISFTPFLIKLNKEIKIYEKDKNGFYIFNSENKNDINKQMKIWINKNFNLQEKNINLINLKENFKEFKFDFNSSDLEKTFFQKQIKIEEKNQNNSNLLIHKEKYNFALENIKAKLHFEEKNEKEKKEIYYGEFILNLQDVPHIKDHLIENKIPFTKLLEISSQNSALFVKNIQNIIPLFKDISINLINNQDNKNLFFEIKDNFKINFYIEMNNFNEKRQLFTEGKLNFILYKKENENDLEILNCFSNISIIPKEGPVFAKMIQ